ncbi:MAG: polyvinylalcohol dehydrogenase, partial [Gemmataceae bacterium]
CVIPTPVVSGDLVYTTVGFGMGCDLVKISAQGGKLQAEKVWANRNLQNQSGGVVIIDDNIYGHSEGKKSWVCQSLKTGDLVWTERRSLSQGSVIAAEGLLYCYGEQDGSCVLAAASPKAWTERGRFTIPQKSTLNKPSGRIWTHPVIANGKLYLRDQELLFCFDIKK